MLESEPPATARLRLSVPASLASALSKVGAERLGSALQSLLEEPNEQPIVGDPPKPTEIPIRITIPEDRPREFIPEIEIEVTEWTLRLLLTRSQEQGITLQELILQLLEKSVTAAYANVEST